MVVCCLHGDEPFGAKVFNYLEQNSSRFGTFKVILANTEALSKKTRFIDADLNRCFPGNKRGNYEQQLAYSLIRHIPKSSYIIDLHTTITDIKFTAIVTTINRHTKRLLNVIPVKNIVHVANDMENSSLIGQFERGVSLEINRKFAQSQSAFDQVISIIERIAKGEMCPTSTRKVFAVDGVVKKSLAMPKDAQNFRKARALGLYPILYHKNSYPDIHCLSASKYKRLKI